MASEAITPFHISVSDDVLSDIQTRLNLARLPINVELSDDKEWNYGTPAHRVQDLVDYWKNSFNWRTIEADINAKFPQFTTPIDAGEPHGILSVHFVHKRSPNPNAVPLLFVHGWPGNFLEVAKIIEPLTNPSDPKDPAFHVVAPSLPGFVFSESSKVPGFSVKTTALMFDNLMKKLGYDKYIAQGGDWGAIVIKALAVYHSESCRATHSNMPLVWPPKFYKIPLRMAMVALGFLGLPGGYSRREIEYLKDTENFDTEETGYSRIQSTKPQTLAYGLTDSPTALLAWIYEKLHGWADNYPWTKDEILTWVMLYWISDAGPVGGLRFYKQGAGPRANGELIKVIQTYSSVPLGVSIFPKEIHKFPDEWHNMSQPVKYFKHYDSGGHFAAHERPEILVEDIRRFTEIILRQDKAILPK